MKKNLGLFTLFLVLYEMATYLANDLYLPAMPDIAREFNVANHYAQLTLTAFLLGAASMQLILGPVSDRYGRRPVLLIGGIFFILSTMTCAMTENITVLLIARFIQGTSVCSVVVAGYASIHELLEHKEAIKTLSWMNSIIIIAPAFGPLIGGVILQFGTWRMTFWILAIWAMMIIATLYRVMPESNPDGKEKHPFHFKKLITNYKEIIKTPGFIVNALSICCFFSGMIAWIASGPFLVIEAFHYNVLWFGFFQFLIFACFILGTRTVNRLIEKVDVNFLINIGLSLALIGGGLAVALALLEPHSLFGFVLALMFFSAGTGILFAPLNRLAMEACTQPMGMRVAMYSMLLNLCGVFGSLLVTLFYNKTLLSLALITAGVAVLGCVIKWGIPHRDPHTN